MTSSASYYEAPSQLRTVAKSFKVLSPASASKQARHLCKINHSLSGGGVHLGKVPMVADKENFKVAEESAE